MKSSIFTEVWKDIEDYEGLYQVSNLGRVRSVDFSFENGKSTYIQRRIINQEPLRGYLKVNLSKNNKHKHFQVHRLVAEAFLPNLDNLPQVNHINECPWDNAVWNLEWCDAKYNVNYGNCLTKRGNTQKKTMSTMKPVLQYTLDGQFVAEYPSMKEAARQTGVDNTYISTCCREYRNSKTAGGYIWKYKI